MDESEFQQLLQQVRLGDQNATNQLVNHFEEHIQRIIRVRLAHSVVRRNFESADIFQSVMLNLFVKLRMGLFDLNNDDDLIRVVTTMVKNKVIDKQRKVKREKHYLENSSESLELEPAKNESTPSSLVEHREILQSVTEKLTENELFIMKKRQDGKSWDDIGESLGTTAEAASKRLHRGVRRVFCELGLESGDE